MTTAKPADKAALDALARFLAPGNTERVFQHPCPHPSGRTGFCHCDRGPFAVLWFYLKAAVLLAALRSPFNSLKIALLRLAGAKIGRQVYISTDVWIDPMFPQLLTIDDRVLLGVGAKIFLHEFTQEQFRAGRVHIGSGSIIGGSAIIRSGITLGQNASLSAGAVLGRDVPDGKLAVGNPARIFSATPGDAENSAISAS